ncbi:hypothetical protein [Aestuariivirga sp.]|uniref:hypothetical protein n=1 Tax=Aestuariivirga sp. TaxID=2650926 RepID=UPI00391BC53D
MLVLKAVSVLVAGLLSVLAVSLLMRGMQAAKVKAPRTDDRRNRMRRLRQDPRTGVYYPED